MKIRLIAMALIAAPGLFAQGGDQDVRRELDELRKEIAELRQGGAQSSEDAPDKGVDRLLSDKAGETTVGGYGELHYNSPQGAVDTLDFHRFIFHITHRFDERLSFASEIELEHAFVKGGNGELELEQAHLTYRLLDNLDVRAGVLLLPMGYVNRYHEPPTFYSVERPEFSKNIVPTTWFESGISFGWTPTPDVRLEAGVFGPLDATKFKAGDGVRSGRQKAFETKVNEPAYSGRLEYLGFQDLHLAGAFYIGNSNQTDASFGSARVTGVSGELVSFGQAYGLPENEVRIEAAMFTIDGNEDISTALGASIPGRFWGFYIEDAYQIYGDPGMKEKNALFLFARFEYLRNQSDMNGVVADPTKNREKIVFGAAFRPHPRVVFKMDYEWIDDRSGTIDPPDQWNLGIGYMF
ncbi:MAG: OprO/OprP family phosphate-selective porin [Planctomycetes bacterium]|nr:OprO/OprP family phosphate-selective porin [Planctomycetota bacterium]NUQ34006.1 hypothetical protein [Planctomycetaceae bacterium]